MNSFSLVSILVVAFSLVCLGNAWAFTDVATNNSMRSQGEDFNETDNEVPQGDIPHYKFSLIYPGTKWCGPGNVADDNADLGTERQTDMCCRTHDTCPDIIHGLETKHNLTNITFFTKLSCDCDETFRSCLHAANSSVANQIGGLYFNFLGTKCFRKDYPVTGCKERGGFLNTKCLQYSYNKTGQQEYQYFDVSNY